VLLKDAGCSSNAARVGALWLGDERAIQRDFRTIGTGLPALLGFVAGHAGAGAARRLRATWHLVRHHRAIARELARARCQRGAEVARQLRFGEALAAGIAGIAGIAEGLTPRVVGVRGACYLAETARRLGRFTSSAWPPTAGAAAVAAVAARVAGCSIACTGWSSGRT
jgi:hypothetical protein